MPPRKKPPGSNKSANGKKGTDSGKKPLFRVKNEFDSTELLHREKLLSQAKGLLERGRQLKEIYAESLRKLTATEMQELKDYRKWFLNHHEKHLANAKDKYDRGHQLRFIFSGNYRPLTEKEKKELREYEDYLESVFISSSHGGADKEEMRRMWRKNHPRP